jgi:hypothetical protein
MKHKLPELIYEDLLPTRDYLQEVALVLGSLQRAYIPKHPRDWHYGLEVNLRGLITQPIKIENKDIRASLDLVRNKFRIGKSSWLLNDYAAPEIYNNVRLWLESHGEKVDLELPKFSSRSRHFNPQQAKNYATALWWMETQFHSLKTNLIEGLSSPILLFPHHFDLSLVWFPYNDDRQVALGFSTGDETIPEPYLYLTAYPEPAGFTALQIPSKAFWQSDGFSGAILPYSALSASSDPVTLFKDYTDAILNSVRPLFN